MKKIVVLCSILLMAIALSACTNANKTTVNSPTPSPAGQSNDSLTITASGSATATFAPTSDEDIKSIDKTMDEVNLNDYSDKALDDLK
jgi:ABC-type molybdate transport system substrate-binding protein